MPTLIISPEAEQDLLEIWLYIAEDDPASADRFLDRLANQAQSIAAQPGIGSARPELKEGLRSFPVGRYLLFYREVQGRVELVRVLHGARDIGSLL